MNISTSIRRNHAIVYDGALIDEVDEGWFDAEAWRREGRLRKALPGRGSTSFIDTQAGPAVLRQYLRGGWPARFSRDHYLFTGYGRSRPFREFYLLARMRAAGLPVPDPLAAWCRWRGLLSVGALLTVEVEQARTLLDELERSPEAANWERVGACLARFHREGVNHADLNARNILIRGDDGQIFLVDFDRSQYRPGHPVDGRANLRRLRRSLDKWCPPGRSADLARCWQWLEESYRG